MDNVANVSVQAQDGQDLVVSTTVPDRGETADSSQYACLWGFRQEVLVSDDKDHNWKWHEPGTHAPVFISGEKRESGDIDSNYYITQGNNEEGFGRVGVIVGDSIDPGQHYDLQSRSPGTSENAEHLSQNLWQHYPYNPVTEDRRHPGELYRLNN
jgi:hypothetical protein